MLGHTVGHRIFMINGQGNASLRRGLGPPSGAAAGEAGQPNSVHKSQRSEDVGQEPGAQDAVRMLADNKTRMRRSLRPGRASATSPSRATGFCWYPESICSVERTSRPVLYSVKKRLGMVPSNSLVPSAFAGTQSIRLQGQPPARPCRERADPDGKFSLAPISPAYAHSA